MKIKEIKVANSLRVGDAEATYLTKDKFLMTLDGVLVDVECKKTGRKVTTSLFNTIWFVKDDTDARENPPRGTKAPVK